MNRILITLFTVISTLIQAQHQNILVKNDSIRKNPGYLYLGVNNLAFIKNNEYFNLIADGYTLIGNKLDLNAIWKPHRNYQINIGFSTLKYAGRNDFEKSVPYIGLEINNRNSNFYIGKLYTNDNHLLPDEIYAFERHLDYRSIENGLQHRFKNAHWQTDTWLEWEDFIFKGDHLRERLNFGQSTIYTYQNKQWTLSIPLNIYLQHRGGQINKRVVGQNTINNAMVINNMSMGINLKRSIGVNKSIGISYAYLAHQINSDNTEELLFKSGYAHKWQLFFNYKYFNNYLGYWQGHQFVAPKGDDMFQSVSRRVEKFVDDQGKSIEVFKYHTEPNRRLLTWTTTYQKEIFNNLKLAFVLDLYYQLNHSSIQNSAYTSQVDHQFDYATGLYLLYKFDFKLLKVKF
ncbi:MAG TPA: hypothetical protein ENK64_02025 [Flavobacteriales bacterium]|nr:hypothetical protein [Flavobacteriales bacterium]